MKQITYLTVSAIGWLSLGYLFGRTQQQKQDREHLDRLRRNQKG